MLLPIVLFVSLIYSNRAINTPIILFSNMVSLIIGVIATLFIIGITIWAKNWISIIVIALLKVPDYLLL